jgi:acetyl-CoA carboxylase carboxyl transferase subunit alpha
LALGRADHVIMLEHSIYSVASPEGCAAILWGDATKAGEAAARLRLTSEDLKAFGIVDEIVAEPLGGAHRDGPRVVAAVLDAVGRALDRLGASAPSLLVDARYKKFRSMGVYQERGPDRAEHAA